MDTFRAFTSQLRALDIRHDGVALGMLGIFLFALYSHIFSLVIIPLLWTGYRVGKEIVRREAYDVSSISLAPISSHPKALSSAMRKNPVVRAVDFRVCVSGARLPSKL